MNESTISIPVGTRLPLTIFTRLQRYAIDNGLTKGNDNPNNAEAVRRLVETHPDIQDTPTPTNGNEGKEQSQ